MTTTRLAQLGNAADSVSVALTSLPGRQVCVFRPGCWTLDGGQEGPVRITAERFENRWLRFSAPVPETCINGAQVPACAWDLLKINGGFSGAAKLALPPGHDRVTVMRDLWLDEASAEDEISPGGAAAAAAPVRAALADIGEALAILRGGDRGAAPKTEMEGGAEEANIQELCHQANWPCHPRAEGRVAVPLDIPCSFAQAILQPGARICAVVELPLGQQEALSPQSRQAIGMVLLQLAGHVRMVRAAVHVGPEGEAVVLEAQLGLSPSAAALHHMLAALSVAARMVLREVPALASREIAEKYLSIRGWSP